MGDPTTLLTRFAEELRRAPGAGDFGLLEIGRNCDEKGSINVNR